MIQNSVEYKNVLFPLAFFFFFFQVCLCRLVTAKPFCGCNGCFGLFARCHFGVTVVCRPQNDPQPGHTKNTASKGALLECPRPCGPPAAEEYKGCVKMGVRPLNPCQTQRVNQFVAVPPAGNKEGKGFALVQRSSIGGRKYSFPSCFMGLVLKKKSVCNPFLSLTYVNLGNTFYFSVCFCCRFE